MTMVLQAVYDSGDSDDAVIGESSETGSALM